MADTGLSLGRWVAECFVDRAVQPRLEPHPTAGGQTLPVATTDTHWMMGGMLFVSDEGR